jgi:pilus assembly protein CpaB
MVTTADIKAGDALRKSVVREAGLAQKIPAAAAGEPPLKAFPIQANSLSGVGDLMQPGDFVDVLGSFRVDVTTLYNNGQGVNEKTSKESTTKMLLQDVEVLDVLKPSVPAEGETASEPTPAPETTEGGDNISGESTSANELIPGNWIIVLAVTDEEAEILRFTLNQGFNLTTILRRAGDHAASETTGTTMKVLIDTYGLPMPRGMEIEQRGNLSTAPTSSNN